MVRRASAFLWFWVFMGGLPVAVAKATGNPPIDTVWTVAKQATGLLRRHATAWA